MSTYQSAFKLPVFTKLQALCVELRDTTVVPMRDSLLQLRNQLVAERERLARVRNASSEVEAGPTRAIEPRVWEGTDPCRAGGSSEAL